MESKGILTKIANVLREVDKVVANLLFNKSKIDWISNLNLSQTTKNEVKKLIFAETKLSEDGDIYYSYHDYTTYEINSNYDKLAKNVSKCYNKKTSFKDSKYTYLNPYIEIAFNSACVNNKIDSSIEKYREAIQIVSKGMIRTNYFQQYDGFIDDIRGVRRKLKRLFKSLGYPTILDDMSILNNIFPKSLFEKFDNEFYNYWNTSIISNQLYNYLISAILTCSTDKYIFDKYYIPRNN